MKTERYNQKRELQRKEALFLRYGNEEPTIDPRPRPLLTLAFVGRLMRLKASQVAYIEKAYFQADRKPARQSLFVPKYRPKPKGRARVTEANLTPEEAEFLLGSENQQAWAHVPLLGRCILFHRRFPERWLGRVTLGRIMRKAGLRKKVVRVRNAPQRSTQRLEEFEDRTVALDDFVKGIQAKQGHLVFADEAVFTARGFQMSAWARPGENVEVEDRTGKQPCQAVCAAVCACHSLLTFAIEDYSFDEAKFSSFLEQVRDACGDGPVWLFLDNASVHRCSRKKMAELDITPVWNVPYSPEYNAGVERYWAQLKAHFRPLLLSKMLKEPGPRAKDTPLRDAVRQTIRDVPTTSIPAFIVRALESLSTDAAAIRLERKLQGASVHAVVGSPER